MARSKSPSPPARASKKRSSRRSSDDDDSDEDDLRKKTERSEKRKKSSNTGGKLDSRAAENERSKEEGEIHLEDKGRVKTTGSDVKKTTKPLVVKNNTNGRAGGAYVPPFKLAQMMREIEDKSSPEYQRITWEALKKSINGLVNKINSSNVKNIVPELFNENLVRGKGLFARSVMKSQMASPQFSPVFAALVAVTNTKFPELGELVVKRVVLQFRRAFKRNDKSVCVAATKFLASLVNQQVRGIEIVRSVFLFMVSFPSWLVGSFLRFTYARADEFEQHSHRKANDE
jgi:pre-mRNA-splicing factor CWC22